MIEPAEAYPEDAVLVELAGRQWPVPVLVWRDLKKCRYELIELQNRFNDASRWLPPPLVDADDDHADEAAKREKAMSARNAQVLGSVFNSLPNEDYDRLVMGPIFIALHALHPKLTRDEFESWHSSEAERQFAWLMVRTQTGMFLAAAPEDDDAGEAAGDTQPPSQTGSASFCDAADITATLVNTGGET